MSATKTPSTVFSKMENAFIASSTLKRNKRYLDIEKINGQEVFQHLRRRKPRPTSKSIDQKISRSFSNSTAALTERREKDISRFKSKFHSQERPVTAQSTYMRESDSSPSKQIKGVGLGQHISREQYYKIRSKPVLDERLFNNFKLQAPDEIHTSDLKQGPERNFDSSIKYINDLEYNTRKLYQTYYYKRTNMDCRVHYKKEKEEERFYFIPKREENKPATELSPKAVKKAEDTVRISKTIDSFFMNSGRQLPCQLEQRSGSALSSHWRDRENVIQRPFPEYSVRNMKERLCEQRREKISASKRCHFKRGEICDKKYFIVQGSGY